MTKAEISLLEKGLTFVPTNRKIDLTGLLTEIKEWERRLRLKEFFFDKEGKDDEDSTYDKKKKNSDFTPMKEEINGLTCILTVCGMALCKV